MSARHYDVPFPVELVDHADIEHEADDDVTDRKLMLMARLFTVRRELKAAEAKVGNLTGELQQLFAALNMENTDV